MRRLRLNQVEMARLLGVSVAAVNRWLNGNREMPETVLRLLVLLDNGRNKDALAALHRYDPNPYATAAREMVGKRGPGRPPNPVS